MSEVFDSEFDRMMDEAEQKGIKQGMVEGRIEGRIEGRKEGRKEGIEEGKLEVLRYLMENNSGDISVEKIAEKFNYSISDVLNSK